MNYGLGFNSLTGKIRGDALVPGQAKEIKGVEGQTIRYYLSKVESVEELHTQLGLSAEVNAQFGLFGASAKFDFAQTSSFNSYSVFMVARVEVINAFRQLDGPRLDPPAEALLKPGGDQDRFAEQFGDSFIISMQTGGEFCAVMEFRTTSKSDQQSISASLEGSYGLAFDADVSFSHKMRSVAEHRFMKVSMYQAGGTDTTTTNNIEQALAKIKTFAASVETKPVPYSALIIDYRTLDLPAPPTWVDVETARAVLLQFARHRQALLTMLNDIDYVRENNDQFVDPDIPALNAAAAAIATRLNELTANARQAVKDPEHAEHKDVGVPEVELPERNPGAPIEVVSLVGLRGMTVKTVMDAPTRPYTEYLAWCDQQCEQPAVAVKPSLEQYNFLTSGIKVDGQHLSTGVSGFWSWVFEQLPDKGTVEAGDTVKPSTKVKGTGWPPPELRHLWGL
jgi:hypothetical protein